MNLDSVPCIQKKEGLGCNVVKPWSLKRSEIKNMNSDSVYVPCIQRMEGLGCNVVKPWPSPRQGLESREVKSKT